MIQFNYYINTICNQYCDYCYARSDMKWNSIIPYSKIKSELEIFKHITSLTPYIFSLIGGEPTLHPQFKKILDDLLSNPNNIHIYTNGTTNFFEAYNDYHNYKWTFSFHGKETDFDKFTRNILKVKNLELTVPAQNMTKELLQFINTYQIPTLISFIHDTNNNSFDLKIEDWVFDINGPHIINMSKYSINPISYKGYRCQYQEVNILNSTIYTNDCNHSLNIPLKLNNLNNLFKLPFTICENDFCKKDCAFLLPKKELIC